MEEFLPSALRRRVHIVPIGSDQAVLRQLAAHFRENDYSCIAILDGDKAKESRSAKETVKRALEKRYNGWQENEVDAWLDGHLRYFPGETCPEKWILSGVTPAICQELSVLWGTTEEDVAQIAEEACGCVTHTEFHFISGRIGLPEVRIRADIIRAIAGTYSQERKTITAPIQEMLKEFES